MGHQIVIERVNGQGAFLFKGVRGRAGMGRDALWCLLLPHGYGGLSLPWERGMRELKRGWGCLFGASQERTLQLKVLHSA